MNSNAFKNGVSLKPSAAVLDAECKAFRFYSEGIIKNTDCYPFDYPNFSVTAVGYGKDNSTGIDFIKLLVPWGEEYGQKGHVLIEDTLEEWGKGTLGIFTYPSLVPWVDGDK